jgi:regulator of replication initiation timing
MLSETNRDNVIALVNENHRLKEENEFLRENLAKARFSDLEKKLIEDNQQLRDEVARLHDAYEVQCSACQKWKAVGEFGDQTTEDPVCWDCTKEDE